MAEGVVRVATCQFPVSKDIARNARYIRGFLRRARRGRAQLAHFSECALSGYAGVDLGDTGQIDFEALREATRAIMALAGDLGLWVVLGSTHELSGRRRPHNCLYLVGPDGKLRDRYDKRFCMPRDLEHYTPGDHFVTFTVNGVKCALLICYDLRFPELYRALCRRGVQCILQSFYNARQPGRSVHTDIMRQTMQCRAATNAMWVSMTNSSAYYSAYPSCVIRPDGVIVQQLPFHRAGMMINTIDTRQAFYDAAGPFRAAALRGRLSNGRATRDRRSHCRTTL